MFKGELLGKGAYGEVRKCLSNIDNKFYAIKLLSNKKGQMNFKEVEITK